MKILIKIVIFFLHFVCLFVGLLNIFPAYSIALIVISEFLILTLLGACLYGKQKNKSIIDSLPPKKTPQEIIENFDQIEINDDLELLLNIYWHALKKVPVVEDVSDLQKLFKNIVKSSLNVIDADFCGLYFHKQIFENELSCAYLKGEDQELHVDAFLKYKFESPFLFKKFEENGVYVVSLKDFEEKVGTGVDYRLFNKLKELNLQTFLVSPIVLNAVFVGYFIFADKGNRKWLETEKIFFSLIKSFISIKLISLDNRHLLPMQRKGFLYKDAILFNDLLENFPGVLFRIVIEKKLTVEYVSLSIQDILGYNQEDFINDDSEKFLEMIHPSDRKKILKEIRSVRPGRTFYEYEIRVYDSKKRMRWVLVLANTIFERNKLIAIDGVYIDITKRKDIEASLLKTQDELADIEFYLSTILDSVSSMLIVVNAMAEITFWNKKIEEFTGILLSSTYGRSIFDVFKQFSSYDSELYSAINTKKMFSLEKIKILDKKDNFYRYINITVYPLRGKNISGAVIQIDDVSDKIHFMEMMLQTEKMTTVSGLAAGVAHELNNPLGAISLSAQNIKRRLDPKLEKNQEVAQRLNINLSHLLQYIKEREINDFIDGILEMESRAANIVEDLLSFCNQSVTEIVYYDVVEIINRLLNVISKDYELKNKYNLDEITIKTYLPETKVMIPCIPNQLQQVLYIIIKNAIQAIRQKKYKKNEIPTIVIRVKKSNFDSARIVIENNGPVISENERRKIFEPFYTTKDVGTGTGLGLSVAYFIIKNNHQGDIFVVSDNSFGVKFEIKLPTKRKNNLDD